MRPPSIGKERGTTKDEAEHLLGVDYAAIDAVLARSEAAIEEAKRSGPLAAALRRATV